MLTNLNFIASFVLFLHNKPTIQLSSKNLQRKNIYNETGFAQGDNKRRVDNTLLRSFSRDNYQAFVTRVGPMKQSLFKQYIQKHPSLMHKALESSTLRNVFSQLQMDLDLTSSQVASLRNRSHKWTYRKNIRSICNYFKSIGIKRDKIAAIVMKAPQIFQYSASNIIETIDFFQSHNLTQEDIIYMITSRPLVLTHSIDDKLKCTLDFFQNDLSMNEASWKRVIIRYPQVFSCKIEHLPIRAKYLEAVCELNNKLDVSWMISAFPPVLWLSEDNIEDKLGFLRDQFSFDKVEMRDILVTYPQILGLSVEKNLKPKISFLLDKEDGGGLTKQELKDFVLYQPALLAYSLSTRIKPRVMKMNEVSIRLSYSPPSIMSLTNTKFDSWLQTQTSTWSIS